MLNSNSFQKPKSIDVLLSNPSTSKLAQITQHCSLMQRLTRITCDFLPSPLDKHCQAANLNNDNLVLYASTSSWATRLRYHSSSLLEHFRCQHHLVQLRSIRIKVNPNYQRPLKAQPRKLVISRHAADIIGHFADTVGHPPLKESLQRLAHRSEQQQQD